LSCLALPDQLTAEPLVIDIDVDPRYADTMPVFEVTILGEVNQGQLLSFVQDCHRRAEPSSDSDWYLAAVSRDDRLVCRSRDLTRVVEMDLETTTHRLAVRGIHRDLEDEQEVVTVFIPSVGVEQRLRFLGSSQPWSEWTSSPILRRLPVPGSGKEGLTEFEVEMRVEGASHALSESGYIKIKKISS